MNEIDVITLDVPLFIRLLEYAREDAKTDLELHSLTTKAIAQSKDKSSLTMDDYQALTQQEGQMVKSFSSLALSRLRTTASTSPAITDLAAKSLKASEAADKQTKQDKIYTLYTIKLKRAPTKKELKKFGFIDNIRGEPKSTVLKVVWSYSDGYPAVDLPKEPMGEEGLNFKLEGENEGKYIVELQKAINGLVALLNA